MKKILTGLIASVVAGSAFAECSYNLDATQSQIDQTDPGSTLFPNISGQKFGFNTFANNGDSVGYLAVSSGYENLRIQAQNGSADPTTHPGGDKTVPTSGIFAYEIQLKVPTTTFSGNEVALFYPIGGMGTTLYNQIKAGATLIYLNNHYTAKNQNIIKVAFADNSQFSYPINTSSTYQRVGFYFDQDLKKIGLIVNGINKGYLANYTEGFDHFAFAAIGGQAGMTSNSSNLNKEVSSELITDHSKLQFNYPTGAKDICGNSI
ncbi:DUF4882 family protein [Acinetobacter guerrae]|uniref:DUF4882 family protein n=1 Tax=Acinetobacter guerrae TaxID=1843371 RepID=UPI00148F2EB3|nr:DUF4882 family protein [Acinetobacter guerrae]